MSFDSSETSVPNRRRTRKRTTAEDAVEQPLEQEAAPAPAKPITKAAAAKAAAAAERAAAAEQEEAPKPRTTRRARVAKPVRDDDDFGASLDFEAPVVKEERPVEVEEKRPAAAKVRRRAPRQDEELNLSFDDFDDADEQPKQAAPKAEPRRPAPPVEQPSSFRKERDRDDVEERSEHVEDVSFDEPAKPSSDDQQGYRPRGGNFQRRDRQQGDRPQGDRYGDRQRSDRPQGDRPQGDRQPYGDRSQGDRSYADRQQGDRPYGDRHQSDRPQGDRQPYGDRPSYGDRQPYGDRQQGDRPQGDRPQGDRGGQGFSGGGRRYRDRYQGGPVQGQTRDRGPDRGGDRGGDRFQNDRGGNGGFRQRGDRPQRPGFQGGAGQQGGSFQKGGRKQPAKANYTARTTSGTAPVVEINGTFTGVLELHPKGYGFLRDPSVDYGSQEHDPFVSSSLVEKHKLREGIMITGHVGPGSRNQGPRLHEIFTIDNREVEEYEQLKHFDELTAINPFEQIKLETGPTPITMRVMDLLTPIGKGQRALIVAPPRTGKTMLLQDIANSVSTNHPEVHLIVLLIDERPEEVTEMRRLVRGEVIASSMDRDVESHVRTSQLIIERGKRIAEAGGDAFILLDSITRTARAFNKWVGNTGRTMTGGLDVKAMDIPKKMFGQARRFDEGGSLTVVGTALINTGSQMDEVIFQEFKGTGNMEMVLSRELADRRIWPAIDVSKSGTRREEKILDRETLEGITMLRRSLVSLSPVEAMEQLTATLNRFPTNKEFLQKIKAIL
jgi:transcription termination factor Rho